jgi:hypothetical protein
MQGRVGVVGREPVGVRRRHGPQARQRRGRPGRETAGRQGGGHREGSGDADRHNGRIPHDEVWKYIKDNSKGLGFRGVVYDPRYFEVPARMLEEHNVLAIEFDQSPVRMAPACGLTFKLILEQTIVHNGDPDRGARQDRGRRVPQERGGFTLKKGRSRGHIDACVAMCMGVVGAPRGPSRGRRGSSVGNEAVTGA